MSQLTSVVTLPVKSVSGDIPKYRFVTYDATNGVKLPTTVAETHQIYGVTASAYVAGSNAGAVSAIPLSQAGILRVESGDNIFDAAVILSSLAGKAVSTETIFTVPDRPNGTYKVLGLAVNASAGSGLLEVFPLAGSTVTIS